MTAFSPSPSDRPLYGLWSLWDMLQSYYPIYQIALEIQSLRNTSENLKGSAGYSQKVSSPDAKAFDTLLDAIHQKCLEYSFTYTSDIAKRIIDRPPPNNYADMLSVLIHLNDLLSNQLETEAVFRIPPERKNYFEQDNLFGPKVGGAFPSCERDIHKAGSCYALGQEDACVHHLMLVLERGLNALAAKISVPYQRINWQNIIDKIASQLKLTPRGQERDFYAEVNAQFGFLKDAYRNHSEHARDDPYDMEKALSLFNHVRVFMQALAKGGLSE